MADNKTDVNINIRNAIAAQNNRQQTAGSNKPQAAIQQKAQNVQQISLKDIINQFTQLKQTINTANTSNNNTLIKLQKNLQALIDIEKQNQTTLSKIQTKANSQNTDKNQPNDKIQSFDDKNFLEHIKSQFESLKTNLNIFKDSINQQLDNNKNIESNNDISPITNIIQETKQAILDKLQNLVNSNNDNISKILSQIKINITQDKNQNTNENNSIDLQILNTLKQIQSELLKNNNTSQAEKLNILINNSQNNNLNKEDFQKSINSIIQVLNQKSNMQNKSLPYAISLDISNIENTTNNFINELNQSNQQFNLSLRENILDIISNNNLKQTSTFDYNLLNQMNEELTNIKTDLTELIASNNKNITANLNNPISQKNINKNTISINMALKELFSEAQQEAPIIQNTEKEEKQIINDINKNNNSFNELEIENPSKNTSINLILNNKNNNQFDFNELINNFSQFSKNIYDNIVSKNENQLIIQNSNQQTNNEEIQQGQQELPEVIGIDNYDINQDNLQILPDIIEQQPEQNLENNDIIISQNLNEYLNEILLNIKLLQQNVFHQLLSNQSNNDVLNSILQSIDYSNILLDQNINSNIPQDNENIQPLSISNFENSPIIEEIENIQQQQEEKDINYTPEQISDQITAGVMYNPIEIPYIQEPEVSVVQEQPTEYAQEPEVSVVQEQPTEYAQKPEITTTQEQPTEYIQEPEITTTQEQPTEYAQEPEITTTQEQPTEYAQEPEVSVVQEQPTEYIQEPEITTTQEQPTEYIQEPEVSVVQEQPTEYIQEPEVSTTQEQIQKYNNPINQYDYFSRPQQPELQIENYNTDFIDIQNPINPELQIDLNAQQNPIIDVPKIQHQDISQISVLNQNIPDQLYNQIDFINKGQTQLNQINASIESVAEELAGYSLQIEAQSNDINDIIANFDIEQNQVRILLKDESFLSLCESTNIQDIILAITKCDEQFTRLNQLKSSNPNLNDLIVLQQKNINQLKNQLLIQKANLQNKKAADDRISELNNMAQQTEAIINATKKQTGLSEETIQQKINEKTDISPLLEYFGTDLSFLQDSTTGDIIDTNAPQVQGLEQEQQKSTQQIVTEAMSRFTDIHSDNPLVKGYFDSYINTRLNDIIRQVPDVSQQQINKLLTRFGNEFENFWGNGQVLIPTADGKTFSPIDKNEIQKQTKQPTIFNLDNIPLISNLKNNIKEGIDNITQTADNIIQAGISLFSSKQKQQQQIEIPEQQEIYYFNSQAYNQDMYDYHINYAQYMDKKQQLDLDFDQWKESGSDDISNYFADIKNTYVPLQVETMIAGNQHQYSEIQKLNLYQNAAKTWDDNFNDGVVLKPNANTGEIEMFDKDLLLQDLQQSLRENLNPPQMPIQNDYIEVIPQNEETPINFEIYNEVDQNGNQYDEYGEIIQPPLNEDEYEESIQQDLFLPHIDGLDQEQQTSDYSTYDDNEFISNDQNYNENTQSIQYINDQQVLGLDQEQQTSNYSTYDDNEFISNDQNYNENTQSNQYMNDQQVLGLDQERQPSTYSSYEDNNFYNYESNENNNSNSNETNSFFNNFHTLYNNSKSYVKDFINKGPDILASSVNPILDSFTAVTELEDIEKENDIKSREMKQSQTNSIISTINNTTSKISESSPNIQIPDNTDRLLEGIAQIVSANKPDVIYIWPSQKNDPPKINTIINV